MGCSSLGPAFLFHLLHQKLQKLQLVAGEPPQTLVQPLQPHGVGKLHREKLLRRDLQIVANVEEHGHGRQIHAVFDVVDIPGALPQRKAHVPGRHALGLPQLRHPLGKFLFFSMGHLQVFDNCTICTGKIYPVLQVIFLT